MRGGDRERTGACADVEHVAAADAVLQHLREQGGVPIDAVDAGRSDQQHGVADAR